MNQPTVRDVMTAHVVTVGLDTPYAEIAAVLAEHRINAVPVLDDLRRLAGVVTEGDLLRRVEFLDEPVDATHLLERPSRRTAREKARAAVARQLMTVPAVTVSPDAGVADAARLMADKRIKQLPVVDRQGRMIGIISRRGLSNERRKPVGEDYLRPADRRPSKVISKALRAGFHRVTQRLRPCPVGSRLMTAR